MFLDDLPTAPRYDAIIVGAGPAGVSCAMALAAARRRVLVLEAGGRQPSSATTPSADTLAGKASS